MRFFPLCLALPCPPCPAIMSDRFFFIPHSPWLLFHDESHHLIFHAAVAKCLSVPSIDPRVFPFFSPHSGVQTDSAYNKRDSSHTVSLFSVSLSLGSRGKTWHCCRAGQTWKKIVYYIHNTWDVFSFLSFSFHSSWCRRESAANALFSVKF